MWNPFRHKYVFRPFINSDGNASRWLIQRYRVFKHKGNPVFDKNSSISFKAGRSMWYGYGQGESWWSTKEEAEKELAVYFRKTRQNKLNRITERKLTSEFNHPERWMSTRKLQGKDL